MGRAMQWATSYKKPLNNLPSLSGNGFFSLVSVLFNFVGSKFSIPATNCWVFSILTSERFKLRLEPKSNRRVLVNFEARLMKNTRVRAFMLAAAGYLKPSSSRETTTRSQAKTFETRQAAFLNGNRLLQVRRIKLLDALQHFEVFALFFHFCVLRFQSIYFVINLRRKLWKFHKNEFSSPWCFVDGGKNLCKCECGSVNHSGTKQWKRELNKLFRVNHDHGLLLLLE